MFLIAVVIFPWANMFAMAVPSPDVVAIRQLLEYVFVGRCEAAFFVGNLKSDLISERARNISFTSPCRDQGAPSGFTSNWRNSQHKLSVVAVSERLAVQASIEQSARPAMFAVPAVFAV